MVLKNYNTSDIVVVRDPLFLEHEASAHPECPERLKAIYSRLNDNPQLRALQSLDLTSATEKEIAKTHSLDLVRRIFSLRGKSGWLDPDTFYSPKSVDAAASACGTGVKLAKAIWEGEYRRGFSLIRPPGHHATRGRSMGFCLFNNIAIAVHSILEKSPSARVAVIDFDLHHGNGTQEIFYDNKNVLFISSHRYPFYPGTGALEEHGAGTTLNFPMGKKYSGAFFVYIYKNIVLPALRAFQPEMIFVSAGYDGHVEDPMDGFNISTPEFGELSEVLMAAAEETSGGKIALFLEGGYNPNALADSVEKTLEAMIESPRQKFEMAPTGNCEDVRLFDEFLRAHSPFFP